MLAESVDVTSNLLDTMMSQKGHWSWPRGCISSMLSSVVLVRSWHFFFRAAPRVVMEWLSSSPELSDVGTCELMKLWSVVGTVNQAKKPTRRHLFWLINIFFVELLVNCDVCKTIFNLLTITADMGMNIYAAARPKSGCVEGIMVLVELFSQFPCRPTYNFDAVWL